MGVALHRKITGSTFIAECHEIKPTLVSLMGHSRLSPQILTTNFGVPAKEPLDQLCFSQSTAKDGPA